MSGLQAVIAAANATIAAALGTEAVGPVTHGTEIAPGVYFAFDDGEAQIAEVLRDPGGAFRFRMRIHRPSQWAALHVRLGAFDLHGLRTLAVAARVASPKGTAVRVCLRSGVGPGFVDTFFRYQIAAYPEPRLHVDAIGPEEAPDLEMEADWRELILFFQIADVELTMHDLALMAA